MSASFSEEVVGAGPKVRCRVGKGLCKNCAGMRVEGL